MWGPDAAHEALRDLVRARLAAKRDQLRARHRLGKFLLRQGRRAPEGTTAWTGKYLAWVKQQRFEQGAQEATLLGYLHEVEHAAARIVRLERTIDVAGVDAREVAGGHRRAAEPAWGATALLGYRACVGPAAGHAAMVTLNPPLHSLPQRRPRVVGVMGRVLGQRDGLGIYCMNLLRHMIALDERSRYVIWLRSQEQHELFTGFANTETQVLAAPNKLWWDQVAVPAAARRAGADLIFNPKFSIPFCTRRPCAFVLQDSDWYLNPGNYPWWDNLYIRLLLPLYCRKASRLLAISKFTLDSLVRHRVLRPEKAEVMGGAVAANFSPLRDEAALRQFSLRHGLPEAFILTAVRAYHTGLADSPEYPGGNSERLIRAYRRYRQQGGALALVVAGHRIEEYLRKRGFGDADLEGVRFLGFVPNGQMHLAYQAATFFVLSKLCDSFGLPILEALATGCPAIVPKTCAAPEVAGSAARLIDPYDEEDIARAMLEVGGSVEMRAELRQRGVVRAQAFTWTQTARRTLAVLDRISPAAAASAA